MTFCLVALGGNVGSVAETFDRAVEQIGRERELAVASVSSYHRSAPVGANAGREFLNAAVAIHAECGPMELLDALLHIEEASGRKRGQRWGPRTLDLDIITFGEEVIDEPRLRVPHPGCWYRRFVLDPLTEIAESVVHPEKLITFGALRERLLARPFCVELAGNDIASQRRLLDDLRHAYPDVTFTIFGEDQSSMCDGSDNQRFL